MNFQARYDVLPNGAYVYYSDTIPSAAGTGVTGRPGDLCVNVATTAGQPVVWRCTAAGSPGTWEVAGQGSAYVVATGTNNTLAVSVPTATLKAGLRLDINTGSLTLQAGANTIALNGGSALALKSHLNVANDIGTVYAAGGVIPAIYNGTLWLDLSQ